MEILAEKERDTYGSLSVHISGSKTGVVCVLTNGKRFETGCELSTQHVNAVIYAVHATG